MNTIITRFREHPLLVVLVWIILFGLLLFAPFDFMGVLFPLLIIIPLIPFLHDIGKTISEMKVLFISQIAFSVLYYLIHFRDILKLELWSDEILSLTIAARNFHVIAREPLAGGTFPPFFYWELSLWQSLLIHTPAYFTEFIYRIPQMFYHSLASILFSYLVVTMFSGKSTSTMSGLLYRWLAFFLYFFNPLLSAYALEVRPYAFIALSGVIMMLLLYKSKIPSLQFIPVQLFFGIVSFFSGIFSVILVAFTVFTGKRRRIALYSLLSVAVVYSMLLIFLHVPNTTSASISTTEIEGVIRDINGVFFPTVIQVILSVVALIISLRRLFYRIIFFAGVLFTDIILIADYVIRYQAFAPRHLIILFPLVLFILSAPIVILRTRGKVVWSVLLTVFILIPWIGHSEFAITHQSYAPKISIGIKQAILSAINQKRTIYLDKIILPRDEKNYYTYKYYEDQALWYINRYTNENPIRLDAEIVCGGPRLHDMYMISFRSEPCLNKSASASVLRIQIHDL